MAELGCARFEYVDRHAHVGDIFRYLLIGPKPPKTEQDHPFHYYAYRVHIPPHELCQYDKYMVLLHTTSGRNMNVAK